MSYTPLPQQTEGTKANVISKDDEVRDILYKILKELQAINLNLSIINDSNIKGDDLVDV